MMDCPINWAHQQDRQAEALVSHRKYADAISCHQRALEFLQEAMRMTEVKEALMSLQLQCNNHCRQQRILKEKWKKWEVEQEKQKQEQQKMLQERQNQDITEKQTPSAVKINTSGDSVDGKKGTEHSQSSSLVISAENFSVSSTSSLSDYGAASKDEKSTMQDLEGQVRDLQMQVLSLSQNLEDCNRENRRLNKALADVHEFVRLKFGCELKDTIFECHLTGQEFENASGNDDVKTERAGQGSSLGENVLKDIQDECGNNSKLDENIPLPPLEEPQFIYEDESSEKVNN